MEKWQKAWVKTYTKDDQCHSKNKETYNEPPRLGKHVKFYQLNTKSHSHSRQVSLGKGEYKTTIYCEKTDIAPN